MKRINEELAAKEFIESLKTSDKFAYNRSLNTEVDYSREKEQRDTRAIKDFLNSYLLEELKNM